MNCDIIIVTYNSDKYIENCVNSILKSDYDLKKIEIIVCDNASVDNTVSILKKLKLENEKKFSKFQIIENENNLGFGKSNNIAASYSQAEYLFFLNSDCEIFPDTISKIATEISKKSDFGILELKQTPYEHPKYFDPITLETKWASGACFVVKNNIFKTVKGFDKNIFMYCEDVDLSWKIRKLGYKIYYLYYIPIVHYSYKEANEFKVNQYINTVSNNLYLRLKYGSLLDIIKGFYISLVCYRNVILDSRIKSDIRVKIQKQVKKNIILMFFKGVGEWFKRIKFIFRKKRVKFKFKGLEYSSHKEGAFYQIKNTKKQPLVSILVRTCNRPSYLRETLISIKNQTYSNIEVIVVEDGPDTAGKMIKEEFSDLNIIYKAMEKNVGRCKAGNKALELASGKYLNFLDDDDLFYPDHVETLVGELENANEKIAYTTAFETPIIVHSKEPYKYSIVNENVVYSTEFNILKLLYCNIVPIQAVMFNREVYEKCGGFDEKLDALEDWELWLRFALDYSFKYIQRTTSIYRVPADKDEIIKRGEFLTKYLEIVRKKYQDTTIKIKGKDVPEFYEYMVKANVNPKNERLKKILRIFKIIK